MVQDEEEPVDSVTLDLTTDAEQDWLRRGPSHPTTEDDTIQDPDSARYVDRVSEADRWKRIDERYQSQLFTEFRIFTKNERPNRWSDEELQSLAESFYPSDHETKELIIRRGYERDDIVSPETMTGLDHFHLISAGVAREIIDRYSKQAVRELLYFDPTVGTIDQLGVVSNDSPYVELAELIDFTPRKLAYENAVGKLGEDIVFNIFRQITLEQVNSESPQSVIRSRLEKLLSRESLDKPTLVEVFAAFVAALNKAKYSDAWDTFHNKLKDNQHRKRPETILSNVLYEKFDSDIPEEKIREISDSQISGTGIKTRPAANRMLESDTDTPRKPSCTSVPELKSSPHDKEQLFLAPAANTQAKSRLQDTVISQPSSKVLHGHVDGTALDIEGVWGAKSFHQGTVSRMQQGDYLLFYTGSGRYALGAQIQEAEKNPELMRSLWPETAINNSGKKYPYAIYLGQIIKIEIPAFDLHRALGYSLNYSHPIGMTGVDNNRTDRRIQEFGSLKQFLETYSDCWEQNPEE